MPANTTIARPSTHATRVAALFDAANPRYSADRLIFLIRVAAHRQSLPADEKWAPRSVAHQLRWMSPTWRLTDSSARSIRHQPRRTGGAFPPGLQQPMFHLNASLGASPRGSRMPLERTWMSAVCDAAS